MASAPAPASAGKVLDDNAKAFLDGSSPTIAPASIIVMGEVVEEAVKDYIKSKGIKLDMLSDITDSLVVKYGLKAISHAGARTLAHGIMKGIGIDNPLLRMGFAAALDNAFAGGAIAVIENSAGTHSVKDRLDNAIVTTSIRSATDPQSGLVGIVWTGGVGGGLVHPPLRDADGKLVKVMFQGNEVYETACGCRANACREHELMHLPKVVQIKGDKGKVTGHSTVPSGIIWRNEAFDAPDALRRTANAKCSWYDLVLGEQAKAAPEKAKTWLQNVGPEGNDLFVAMLRFPHTTHDDILDDIEGIDIGKEAVNVPVDEWKNLAIGILGVKDPKTGKYSKAGNKGVYAGTWQEKPAGTPAPAGPAPGAGAPPAPTGWWSRFSTWISGWFTSTNTHEKVEGLTPDGFALVLDLIRTKGKGKLEAHNVAKVGLIHTGRQIGKFWNSNRGKAVGLLIVGIVLPIGYLGLGAVILYQYYDAMFHMSAKDGATLSIFLWSIATLLWLVAWYFTEGIKKAFGGMVNTDLADMARNLGALFCGFGSVFIVMKAVQAWLMGEMDGALVLTSVPAASILAVIAYNRIAAKWKDSDDIQKLEEKLARNNVWILSALASAIIIGAIGAGYFVWADANTKFRLSVEKQSVSITVPKEGGVEGETEVKSVSVYYVPTPDGKLFRVEDVVGRIQSEFYKQQLASADHLDVCLQTGTDVELPGYAENEMKGLCNTGQTGYTIRAHVWGDFLDKGYTSYDSKEALFAAQQKSDAALKKELAKAQPKVKKAKAVETKKVEETKPAQTSKSVADSSDDDIPDMFK